MKHIIGYAWFTSRQTVGIVVYRNQVGSFKSVIGVARDMSEETDASDIADYGAKFPLKEALSLIKENGAIKDFQTFESAVQETQKENGK